MRKERKVAKEATRGIEKMIAAGKLDFSALCELHATAMALDQCGFALEPRALESIRRHAVEMLESLTLSSVDVPLLDDVSTGFIKGDMAYVQAVLTFEAFYRALNNAAGNWADSHRSKPHQRKVRQSASVSRVDEPPTHQPPILRAELNGPLETPAAVSGLVDVDDRWRHVSPPDDASQQQPKQRITLPRSSRRFSTLPDPRSAGGPGET